MTDVQHGAQLPSDGIHTPYAWKFDTALDRSVFNPSEGLPATAAELTSADIHKVALQTDDMTSWILTAVSPVTWVPQGTQLDNSVIATISGSTFTGPVIAGGGLTGSLQRLATGETYLAGVGGVSITTGSNGQVLVSGSNDTTTAGTGLSKTGNALNINDNVVATISGSRFTGPVQAVGGLSGSLQRLTTGETAFAGVGGITVTTGSNGQVLISGSNDTTSAGTGLTKTGNVLSINDNVVATVSGTTFTGVVNAPFLSGSLQRLPTGETYLAAGRNTTVVTSSNGQVQVAALAGPYNPNWSQATWYVDSVGGLDTNTGLTGSALQTTEELSRRLCPGGQIAVLQQDTTVFLQGSFNELVLNIDWFPTASYGGNQFIVQGFVSSSAPITLSAVTNTNSATSTRGQITTLAGSFVAGKRVRLTSGGSNIAFAYCTGLNANAQNAFVGPWYNWNAGAVTTVSPGATVVVDTLTTTVNRVVLTVQGMGYNVIRDLIIPRGARCINNSVANANAEFWGCELPTLNGNGGAWGAVNYAVMFQCKINGITTFNGGVWIFDGCYFTSFGQFANGYTKMGPGNVIDGGTLNLIGGATILAQSDIEVENGNGGNIAIAVDNGSNFKLSAGQKIWGASAAYGMGFQVTNGGWAFIPTAASVSIPATINYQINGLNYTYAQAPISIPGSNCGVVLGTDPSPAIITNVSGTTFSSPVNAQVLSGSLQQTTGGISYLAAAGQINITSQSNGQLLIDSFGTGSAINPIWLVSSWYVDAVTGSDANNGLTQATALRTTERLSQVLCPNGSFWAPQQTSVIYVGSGSYNRLSLNVTYNQLFTVTVQGAVSSSSPITLSAVTASVAATPTRGGLATTAGTFIAQKRIRAISGAASGSVTYSTGLDVDSLHTFVKPFFRESDSSLVFPSVADNVVVEQPLTNINTIEIGGVATYGGLGTAASTFIVKDIVHRDTYGRGTLPNTLSLVFSQCELSGTSTAALHGATYNNCRTIAGTGAKTMSTLFSLFQGCSLQAGISATGHSNFRMGPACAIDGGFFSMNHPSVTTQTGFSSLKLLNDLEMCNGSGQTAFYVGHGCQFIANARVWGSGSTSIFTTGFNATAGGWCYTAAASNLTFQTTNPGTFGGYVLTSSLSSSLSIPFNVPRANTGFALTSDAGATPNRL